MRTRPLALWTAAALAGIALAPGRADAQRRALYAGVGVGPYAIFDQVDRYSDAHFRVQGEFGWHPGGDDTGFFLAATSAWAFNHWVQFSAGVRLGGDIEVYSGRDVAILLAPNGVVGAGFIDYPGDRNFFGFFLLAPCFDVKVALANRLVQLWLRPIGLDFMFFPDYWRPDDRWALGYQFVVGAHFTFG